MGIIHKAGLRGGSSISKTERKSFMSAPANHQLIYTASGNASNPLLIMIHGWLSHRGVWRTTVPTLQDRFFCVAVDLLGFADNNKPPDGDYTIATQAGRIVALADELGFEKFNLIGHSMGGQIATHVAAITAPERVERLISVDGVVTGRLTPFVENIIARTGNLGQRFPALYDRVSEWTEKYRWLANFMYSPWFYDMNGMPFDAWKIDRQMATQRSIAVSASKTYDSLRATDLTSHLGRVQARTLIFSGKQDGTVPVAQAHLLAERVKDAQLVVYDKCGHFPMLERTDEYLAALNDFFAA
jgi:pimeloyl-ACP methyl ester carboxylesterase